MRTVTRILGIIFMIAVLASIAGVNTFRFVDLDNVPPGGQVDELASSVTLQCLASEGVDAHGRRYPVFSDVHYGSPISPVHLYAGMMWVKVCGGSVPSLRALAGVYLIIAIVGLFFLARLMFGYSYALWVIFTASLSPWVWSLSRVAFESLSALPLFVWGLFFLFRLLLSCTAGKSCEAASNIAGFFQRRTFNSIIAAALLALAMYAYPPMRLLVPMIVIATAIILSLRRELKWRSALVFIGVMGIALIPLAQMLSGAVFMRRFNEISIFGEGFSVAGAEAGRVIGHLWGLFWSNMAVHFSPDYLFVKGGGNGVNLARGGGIFSWHEALGLAAGGFFLIRGAWVTAIRKKFSFGRGSAWCACLIGGFFLGIIPAALTVSDLPNALRTIGSWPFAVLLSGYGLWRMADKCRPLAWGALVLAVVFMSFYLEDYFRNYSRYAGGWFQPWVKEQALGARTDVEWMEFAARNIGQDYHVRYYLMRYHGDSCSSALNTYRFVLKTLQSQGSH